MNMRGDFDDMPPDDRFAPPEAYEADDRRLDTGKNDNTRHAPAIAASQWQRTVPLPRQWLYGHHLQRKMLTGTVSPGGIGKSSLTLVDALSMACGRRLLRHWVHRPKGLRVWYWCGEDPIDEISRRLEAACIHYDIADQDIGGRLFVDSGRDQPIKIAAQGERGVMVARPVVDALVAQMKEREIDVFYVDPFITCHDVPENDNQAMNAVIDAWRDVANQANAAIELIHHTNKAGGGDSINDARGASAFRDGIRAGRVLAPMALEEGAQLGLDPAEVTRIFRSMDGAKANMSLRSGASSWFRMESVRLENGTDEYPDGDSIGVCTAWTPPNAFEGITLNDLARVQSAIEARETPPAEKSTNYDWVGYVVAEVLGFDVGEPGSTQKNRTSDQARDRRRVSEMIATWQRSDALRTEPMLSKRDGREYRVIVVGEPAGADVAQMQPQSPHSSAEGVRSAE